MICQNFEHETCFLPSPRFYNLCTPPLHFVELYGVDICFLISWSLKNGWLLWNQTLRHCPTKMFWFYVPIATQQVLWTPWFSQNNLLWISTHIPRLFEKSSMKVLKYLAPPMDVVFIRPHMSKHTIFKGLVVSLHIVTTICCVVMSCSYLKELSIQKNLTFKTHNNKLHFSSSKFLLYLNWTSFTTRYYEAPKENPS